LKSAVVPAGSLPPEAVKVSTRDDAMMEKVLDELLRW
jgi:hypothetical protein